MKKNEYLILIKRLGLAFILYPLVRVAFLVSNFDYFSGTTAGEVLTAFVYGFRFDLSTFLIVNAIFIILSSIPFRRWWYNFFLKLIFVVTNSLALITNIVDLEFFSFLGKKMTFDILDMGKDIKDQSFQLISYYWYLTVPSILVIILLWRFYPKKKTSIMYKRTVSILFTIPISFFLIVVTFIGIRGGLQLRSISPKEAFIFEKYELGNLAINATYTMIRSIGKKGVTSVKYFSTDQDAINLLRKSRDYSFTNLNSKKQNVMIIILESFSQEYIENGYAPFFQKLSDKSLYYKYNFANGRRSLEALPSILTGIPSIIGKPIYQTQYQANEYNGLPKILKENGYSTHFFHGGKRGTMDFDAYTKSIGIDHYHALEDYPDQEHYDGHWGVYDHYYLDYVGQQTDSISEPFFNTVFTLSSHQPYSIPASVDKEFPVGNLEIHRAIGYVDYALEQFFDKIRLKKWYDNTLFIITADHTQKLENPEFKNLLGGYRVPLLMYHPSVDLSEFKKDRITQHVDIMPSVLDFLGITENSLLKYGSSIFNNDQGRMINFISGNYLYLKSPSLVRFDGEKASYFTLNEDYSKLEKSENQSLDNILEELKAYIQLTNNGLKNNNLYKIQR